MTMDYSELKTRCLEVRKALANAKANLVAGEGLDSALSEAEAIADAVSAGRKGTQQAFLESARAASVVWGLSETLRPCLAHGLDLNEHLRTMTTGSVDYGVAAAPNQSNRIYFKDFELELFAASQCINKGAKVSLNPVKNDPSGDLFIQTLRAEVKHPNSTKQLEKLLRKFNGALRANGLYGVFLVGLEDVFQLEPNMVFKDENEWKMWLDSKAQEVEVFGKTFLRFAAKMERLLVTVQTWTIWYQAAGAVNLRRQGNSLLFDDRPNVPATEYAAASQIAAVFNPDYRRWTRVKNQVLQIESLREREVLRAVVQERAYQIWEDEKHPDDRAWSNWFQAKKKLGIAESDHI